MASARSPNRSASARPVAAVRPAPVSRPPTRGRPTTRYVTPKVGHCHSDHLPRKIYQSNRLIGIPAGITTPKRPFFDIHPEWKSESVTLQRLSITDRKAYPPPVSGYHTYPPRRCKSAPPAIRSRNPITWDGF